MYRGNVFVHHPLRRKVTNGTNNVWCKFRHAVTSAKYIAALVIHILNVVKMSSQEQMVWVNTRWIVAPVTHFHPIGNGAEVDLPRHAVGVLLVFVAIANLTVSGFRQCAMPKPARIFVALVKPFPKTLNEWAMSMMPMNKPLGLSFYDSMFLVGVRADGRKLSTTAMAKTVGNIKRGIMGLHRNLPFFAKSQAATTVLGQLFSCSNYSTDRLITQGGAL